MTLGLGPFLIKKKSEQFGPFFARARQVVQFELMLLEAAEAYLKERGKEMGE